MTMKIYTDGSCLRNPGGPGGWAWWSPTTKQMGSGYVATTTNNRMELQASLEAVKALDGGRIVLRWRGDPPGIPELIDRIRANRLGIVAALK